MTTFGLRKVLGSVGTQARALCETIARPGHACRVQLPRQALASLIVALVILIVLAAARWEARTSTLQCIALTTTASRLTYTIGPGPSSQIVFPKSGPLDFERGYSLLAGYTRRLETRGFGIVEQARFSPALAAATWCGISPPFREPGVAGLVIYGTASDTLYDAAGHEPVFQQFEDIPPVIVSTLLIMENRTLQDPAGTHSNPAVDWQRLAHAGLLYAGRQAGLALRTEGGSTLAVQMEKYRHSHGGRTSSPLDKFRQVTTASLRAYRNGPDTRNVRSEIILDYLNTVPLAATRDHGEVIGFEEGLRVWFGLDPATVSRALRDPKANASKARAFKHVLALLYAVRAPSHYLIDDRNALERRIVEYTRLLERAGVIDADLARRTRAAPLFFAAQPTSRAADSAPMQRGAQRIRMEIMTDLGVPNSYRLDRLHLDVESTLDGGLQEETAKLFCQLKRADFVETHGLMGPHLLSEGDPSDVAYSLVLCERTPGGNFVRVYADNSRNPFDLNSGMKMELGSTAKLRTLAHYLELMAALHAELSPLDLGTLRARLQEARDPLTRWAAQTLCTGTGMDLDTFLRRALERTYSASPHEVFFTGGGAHTFRNFDPRDDDRETSVGDATAHSTNLVFIRLMRDLIRFHEARLAYDAHAVLTQPDSPDRIRLLQEVAREEGTQILARAYTRLRNARREELIPRLLGARARSPGYLAALFFAWNPGADADSLARWLRLRASGVSDGEAGRLWRAYGNPRLTLLDYGYVLRCQPLEVWCGGELVRDPEISWKDLLTRSEPARRASSSWLFRTRNRRAQNLRLAERIERDAFARMTPYWRRLGFPFERLVPSYATAIGSSADRPVALADLMGVIVNNGVRRPEQMIRRLVFAPRTPYHTAFQSSEFRGERVLAPSVARALRSVLADVVTRGTGQRMRGILTGPDGAPLQVGGKTGSGDNRFETSGAGGHIIRSRAVSRTAAFAFYLGDRYFGVMTASVSGAKAQHYRFTSALPIEVVRLLAPAIQRSMNRTSPAVEAGDHAPQVAMHAVRIQQEQAGPARSSGEQRTAHPTEEALESTEQP